MVRRDVVGRNIARAGAWLDDVSSAFDRLQDEFLADVKARDLATFYLFLAIQASMVLAAHWVADAGWTVPDEAGATFDVLAEREIITRDLADALRGASGLRNRIAHGYARIDHEGLHQEAERGTAALRQFLTIVADVAGL